MTLASSKHQGQNTEAQETVTTVFAPQFLDTNPYQQQLAEHLARLGVQVEGVSHHKTFLPKSVKQWRPKIIHLHWPSAFYQSPDLKTALLRLTKFIAGLAVFKLKGIKLIWTAHNLKDHENSYARLDQICTWFVAHSADAIIAHCEVAKQEIVKELAVKQDKVTVIPHGSYIDYYENKINRLEARGQLQIRETSLVFLFLGLIRPYKGIPELIEVFQRLSAEGVQLILAGKAKEQAVVEQIQKEIQGYPNIRFIPGFVPDEQIQVYMNACDVVVFPYRNILTSGAAILAMSFGKPCVAPNIGCMGEVLDRSGGFLYCPEHSDGLEQAIQAAIQSHTELAAMGEHNYQVAEQWTWERVAEMTLAVYQQVGL